ncbi:MAG: SIMPL domain-containing protein [Solirubrobacterales bacterium]|nr:SIMPL domain-containing protein [Solirubrobacterales bacterium]
MGKRQAAIAVAVASIGVAPAVANADTTAPSTLSVLGNGTVYVTPDRASVEVDIVKRAATSRAALSAANSRTGAINRALRALGLPAKDIQTSGLDVSKETRSVGPKGHKTKVHDYRASESLAVSSSAAQAGSVIDTSTAHGASDVTGLNFSFSNPSAGSEAANKAALSDARAQADSAAAQLGYKVTGVYSVDLNPESDSSGSGASSGTAATPHPKSAPAPKTPTNVHPGAQEVDSSVRVVFTIAPG